MQEGGHEGDATDSVVGDGDGDEPGSDSPVLNDRHNIIALVDEQLAAEGERIAFKRLRVVAGTEGPQTAEIDLVIDGVEQYSIARGNGPVDAVFNAIRQLVPHQATLELYQVHAVTGGTDAQATVSVRLNGDDIMATGRSSDPDTLVASAKAYLHALNKFEVRKAKRSKAA